MEREFYSGCRSESLPAIRRLVTRRTYPLIIAMLGLFAMVATSQSLHAAPAKLEKIVVVKKQGKTELDLRLSRSVQYKYFTLDNPDRMVVDLKNTKGKLSRKDISLGSSAISNVRFGERKSGTLRVVFDLSEPMLTENLTPQGAKKVDQIGFHLKPISVAMFGKKGGSAVATAKKPQKKELKKNAEPNDRRAGDYGLRSVVVVIDAGHGGKDPGAIGPNGVKEKYVVLKIAKKLAASINQRKGYRAVLTRDDDTYIPLAKRRELARDTHNADLFVSIHADAWMRRSAKGASVYALSRRGAHSTLARHLAAHERGLVRGAGGEKQGVLKTVLADLAMEGSLEHSLKVGDMVLDELGKVAKLHKPKVEKAAFAVLKSPDVPSILIETGFISNPREERLLRSDAYQRKLVAAISKGVDRYFYNQPPPGTWLAAWKQGAPESHKIARGETLSEIAQRYRVSQKRLKQANNLNSDLIRIGQVLYIPGS